MKPCLKIPLFFWLFLPSVLLFAEEPAQQFFVGEKLVYAIRCLGIPIGRAEGRVEELVEREGRKAYHVSVFVKSHPVVDVIYKVRGEHHTWIDAESLVSLGYEAASGTPLKTDLRMRFDPRGGTVEYEYPQKGTGLRMKILPQSQDQLSLGYYFRTLALKENQTVEIPVNADEKNWKIRVKTGRSEMKKIRGVGTFHALKVEPELSFVGMLAKPGRARGWISLDERRIPLAMKVRVPWLGSITAELVEYQPGTEA